MCADLEDIEKRQIKLEAIQRIKYNSFYVWLIQKGSWRLIDIGTSKKTTQYTKINIY